MIPGLTVPAVSPRAALVAAALAAAACTRYQDMERIKAAIKTGVEQQAGAPVAWVDCPARRAAKPGDRFECRAGIEGGAVTVDVEQDEYANVRWTQRELIVDLAKLEGTIREGLKQNFAVEAEVRCPGRYRPSHPGTRLQCAARLPGGASVAVPVLVKDARGQVDWSVPREALAPPPPLTAAKAGRYRARRP